MNLTELISKDEAFITPCSTHFPIDYRVSYGKHPTLRIQTRFETPLSISLLKTNNTEVYGLQFDLRRDPVATLSLINCFKEIIGEDFRGGCSVDGYYYKLTFFKRGMHLEMWSMLPLDIELFMDEYDSDAFGFRIHFRDLQEFKDFNCLLASILYWSLTSQMSWNG